MMFSFAPGLADVTAPNSSTVIVAEAKSNVRLNYTKKTLYIGKTCQLKVLGTKKTVKWSFLVKTP